MQAALAVSGARGASFAAGGRSGPKNLSLTGGDDAEGGASKKEAGAVEKSITSGKQQKSGKYLFPGASWFSPQFAGHRPRWWSTSTGHLTSLTLLLPLTLATELRRYRHQPSEVPACLDLPSLGIIHLTVLAAAWAEKKPPFPSRQQQSWYRSPVHRTTSTCDLAPSWLLCTTFHIHPSSTSLSPTYTTTTTKSSPVSSTVSHDHDVVVEPPILRHLFLFRFFLFLLHIGLSSAELSPPTRAVVSIPAGIN